jgi:hypothetical protein
MISFAMGMSYHALKSMARQGLLMAHDIQEMPADVSPARQLISGSSRVVLPEGLMIPDRTEFHTDYPVALPRMRPSARRRARGTSR